MQKVVQNLISILAECLTHPNIRKHSDTVAFCPAGQPRLRATPTKAQPRSPGTIGAVKSFASAPQLITEVIRQLNTSGLWWNEPGLTASDGIGCFILRAQWDRKRECCLSPKEKISANSEQVPGLG